MLILLLLDFKNLLTFSFLGESEDTSGSSLAGWISNSHYEFFLVLILRFRNVDIANTVIGIKSDVRRLILF